MGVLQPIADTLGLRRPATLHDIVRRCVEQVRDWVDEGTPVASIQGVSALVCRKLGVAVEEVRSDCELQRLVRRYTGTGEAVFAFLPHQLDDTTYGATLRLLDSHSRWPHRYVAVVDCRGPKFERRFFTMWHEIAHLLTDTLGPTSQEVERLVDAVASAVGFYEPLFGPLVHRRVAADGGPTFAGIAQVRDDFCLDASFDATARALVRVSRLPCVLLEATAPAPRGAVGAPPEELKVSLAVANAAACKMGLHIHRGCLVPADSVLDALWRRPAQTGREQEVGEEPVLSWLPSAQGALRGIRLRVEARLVAGRVQALLAPAGGFTAAALTKTHRHMPDPW